MCLKYHKGDGTYYARLCYLTGQAGVHRDLTAEQAENWYWGMFHSERRRGRGKSKQRQYTATFDVRRASASEIADMARYMGTDRYTQNPDTGNVTFWVERGVSQGDIDRAGSFGWKYLGL